MRKRLVVVEQRFAKIKEVPESLAVVKDVEQRRRAAPLDQRVEGIRDGRLVEAPLQPGPLLGRGFQSGQVFRFLEPRQELDLAKLHRLKAAGRCEVGPKGQEILG